MPQVRSQVSFDSQSPQARLDLAHRGWQPWLVWLDQFTIKRLYRLMQTQNMTAVGVIVEALKQMDESGPH